MGENPRRNPAPAPRPAAGRVRRPPPPPRGLLRPLRHRAALPDLQPLPPRAPVQTDNERQRSYLRRDAAADEARRVGRAHQRIGEGGRSYPALPGEDERWERVLEEDGRKRPRRSWRSRTPNGARPRKRGRSRSPRRPPTGRRSPRLQKRPAEALARINDIFLVYDIRTLGRERGRPRHHRPRARPEAEAATGHAGGKWMQ